LSNVRRIKNEAPASLTKQELFFERTQRGTSPSEGANKVENKHFNYFIISNSRFFNGGSTLHAEM